MSELRSAHEELAEILGEFGIDVGAEVLDVWSDRLVHGYEPLPYDALVRLVSWSVQMRDAALSQSVGADDGRGRR